MTDQKQTSSVEHLARYSIVDIKTKGTRVTLVRGDGAEFTFNTMGIFGSKGETGDKGDTGPQGESAYDIAIRLGKTDKDLNGWLQSLKGSKGANGVNGKNGKDGINGKDAVLQNITFSPIVWLPYGEEPYVLFKRNDSDLVIDLFIPVGKKGMKGEEGKKNSITTGTFSAAETPSVEIIDNKLNVTMPAGFTGEPGRNSIGLNASAPDINLHVTYVDSKDKPSVTYEGEPVVEKSWTKTVNIKIPRGQTGHKGARGKQGKNKTVKADAVMKIITDVEEIQDPGNGFCVIAIDNLRGFTGKAYGWSWRTRNMTFQVVRFVNTANGFYTGWWYRTGPAEGEITTDITEGWKRCSFK